MILDIPDDLYPVFVQYLDITQTFFSNEAIKHMSEDEKQLFIWIGKVLGSDITSRYETNKQLHEAKNAMLGMLKR